MLPEALGRGSVGELTVLNKKFIIRDSGSTFVFSSISFVLSVNDDVRKSDVNFRAPLELKLFAN